MRESTCTKHQKALASAAHRRFGKPRGFRKDGMTLRRVLPGTPFGAVHVLNVQGSQANSGVTCRVYVNLGLLVTGLTAGEPERVKEYQCQFRQRLGESWLLPDAEEAALGAIETEGASWFAAREEPLVLLRALESELSLDAIGEWLGYVEPLCRMWAKLGEHDKASAALRAEIAFLARERPAADPEAVPRFARSIGLPRL